MPKGLDAVTSACLLGVYLVAGSATVWGEENVNGQDNAIKAWEGVFGSSNPTEMMKSDPDTAYLTQSQHAGYEYLRRGVTTITARGRRRELWRVNKEVEVAAVFEAGWTSYIIENTGADITEYREYQPSNFSILSARAGYNIIGAEGLDAYFDRQGAQLSAEGSRLRGSSAVLDSVTGAILRGAGVSATIIGELLGEQYEGEEAASKIRELGDVSVVTEPALFSNRQYLIHYRMGREYPDRAVPIVLEGETFRVWSPATEAQRRAESVRQSIMLKSSYLVDQGILPEGRPARKGEQWTVSAGAFSDAVGLRARRIKSHYGSVRLKRSSYNIDEDGMEAAELRLVSSAHNLIHVITEPTQIASGTQETMDIKFEPSYGMVLWSFRDNQIALIRLRGKAFVRLDQAIAWWPDTTSTLIPQFESIYRSHILNRKAQDDSGYQELAAQLGELLKADRPQ